MSIASARHTAHRSKFMKFLAQAYNAGDPLCFDTSDPASIFDDGIRLLADNATVKLVGSGTFRFDIFTTATAGVAGNTYSVVATPIVGAPQTLAALVPFGSMFNESFNIIDGTTVQLLITGGATIGAGDTPVWFEIST